MAAEFKAPQALNGHSPVSMLQVPSILDATMTTGLSVRCGVPELLESHRKLAEFGSSVLGKMQHFCEKNRRSSPMTCCGERKDGGGGSILRLALHAGIAVVLQQPADLFDEGNLFLG